MKKIINLIFLGLLTGQVATADVPSTHGMLLFGDKVLYASHLPMFHAPHNYQYIFKLTLSQGEQTLSKFAEEKTNGQKLFTLVPETMDLTKVMNGTKKDFQAEIFSGHFERGGTNLGSIQVHVEKTIFSAKLNPSSAPQEFHEYIAFGENGEYFAAHIIKEKPNFDAIYTVEQPYTLLQRTNCGRGLCPEPTKLTLQDSALPAITLTPSTDQIPVAGDSIGEFSKFIIDFKTAIYTETGDLAH